MMSLCSFHSVARLCCTGILHQVFLAAGQMFGTLKVTFVSYLFFCISVISKQGHNGIFVIIQLWPQGIFMLLKPKTPKQNSVLFHILLAVNSTIENIL